MESLAVNEQLAKEDIFVLFKLQLQKDFESAGIDPDFVNNLSPDLGIITDSIIKQLEPLVRKNSASLMSLLYRVDISQEQINKHQNLNPDLTLEQILSELIIKRILQKVILKKSFSK